jgi:hypothetical protein
MFFVVWMAKYLYRLVYFHLTNRFEAIGIHKKARIITYPGFIFLS